MRTLRIYERKEDFKFSLMQGFKPIQEGHTTDIELLTKLGARPDVQVRAYPLGETLFLGHCLFEGWPVFNADETEFKCNTRSRS